MTPDQAIVRMLPGTKSVRIVRIRPTAAAADSIARGRRWRPEPGVEHKFYVGRDATGLELPGAVYIHGHVGKHGPIHLAVGLDSSGMVHDLAVMSYIEQRGRPVKEPKYLRQYIGKGVGDPVELGNDIVGISGATFSSTAVTNLVRQAVDLYAYYLAPRATAGAATTP